MFITFLTIIGFFAAATLISLGLTPLAAKAGRRYGALDVPDDRKVHTSPMPRSGGLAIFAVFFLVLGGALFFAPEPVRNQLFDSKHLFFALGSLVAFGIGIVDDFRRINPKIKLLFQICAAAIACYGGLEIKVIGLGGWVLHLGIFSYIVTIFWFVLLMNAINLVDGLDGLAAGIVFFACLVMVVLTFYRREYATALMFATLGGTLLGFLRYNFNPASIFMGDGGSYFLGYAVAGISIMGSIKGQTGVAILIPLIALGVPVFDTIISPIRRFILGIRLFQPDRQHIHHRMLETGLSGRRVVVIMYVITTCLCIAALIIANIRDEKAGIFLFVLTLGAFIFMRRLKYFEYFAVDKVLGWLRDVTDVTGISNQRRSFLNLQIAIQNAKNFDEMWGHVGSALEMIQFDYAELRIKNGDDATMAMKWAANENRSVLGDPEEGAFRVELPLLNGDNKLYGKLVLMKDLKKDPLNNFTIRRIEHLRRAVTSALTKLHP